MRKLFALLLVTVMLVGVLPAVSAADQVCVTQDIDIDTLVDFITEHMTREETESFKYRGHRLVDHWVVVEYEYWTETGQFIIASDSFPLTPSCDPIFDYMQMVPERFACSMTTELDGFGNVLDVDQFGGHDVGYDNGDYWWGQYHIYWQQRTDHWWNGIAILYQEGVLTTRTLTCSDVFLYPQEVFQYQVIKSDWLAEDADITVVISIVWADGTSQVIDTYPLNEYGDISLVAGYQAWPRGAYPEMVSLDGPVFPSAAFSAAVSGTDANGDSVGGVIQQVVVDMCSTGECLPVAFTVAADTENQAPRESVIPTWAWLPE